MTSLKARLLAATGVRIILCNTALVRIRNAVLHFFEIGDEQLHVKVLYAHREFDRAVVMTKRAVRAGTRLFGRTLRIVKLEG